LLFVQRAYLTGMAAAVLIVIAGQLIWIGDPIRSGQDGYWIDLLDRLFYLCMVPPLLWLSAGAASLIKGRGVGGFSLHSARSFLTVLCSAAAIWWILFQHRQWVGLGISLAAAWLAALADCVALAWRHHGARRGLRRLVVWASALLLVLFPTPYMVTYPGMTINMNTYVSVEGGVPKGSISGVLVFERPAFPIDWIYRLMFPHYEFVKRQPDDLPLTGQLHLAQQLRIGADQIGSAIAFQRAGIGSGMKFLGVRVIGIVPDMPAEGTLNVGDLIVSADGQSTESYRSFLEVMSRIRPGDIVELEVKRDGRREVVSVPTAPSPEDPGRAALGIYLQNEMEADLPKEVRFRDHIIHVGGPSHGAMLTLALIDQLVPGGVTGGNIVSGTGTIDEYGRIGPIGGIRQKAYAVSRAGADVFFVPAEQEMEARRGAPAGLNIVPVGTIDDVLEWLKRNPKVKDGNDRSGTNR